jgi:hypothetical protein
MKSSAVASWNFQLFVLLGFYTLGSGFLESMLNYPSWYMIGPTEAWPEYRKLLIGRIIPLLAAPALILQTISNILIIMYRPVNVPRWTTWATFLLLSVFVLSSFFIQIPMQMELDKGYSASLVERLITTDMYLRTLPGTLRVIIIIYMLGCVLPRKMPVPVSR